MFPLQIFTDLLPLDWWIRPHRSRPKPRPIPTLQDCQRSLYLGAIAGKSITASEISIFLHTVFQMAHFGPTFLRP